MKTCIIVDSDDVAFNGFVISRAAELIQKLIDKHKVKAELEVMVPVENPTATIYYMQRELPIGDWAIQVVPCIQLVNGTRICEATK